MRTAIPTSRKQLLTRKNVSLTGPGGKPSAVRRRYRRAFFTTISAGPGVPGPGRSAKDGGPALVLFNSESSMRAACVVGNTLHVFYDNAVA